MKTGRIAAGLCAAFFFALPAQADPPSAEAFGALPLAEIGRLSPDGKHLAVIQPIKGRSGVMIYDLSSPSAQLHAVALDQAVAEDIFWKTDDRLICIFVAHLKQKWSNDIHAWSRAISVDANGQNAVLLLRDAIFLKENLRAADIVDRAPNDPWHVYIDAFETNAEMNGEAPLVHDAYSLNLFKVNVALGSAELVRHGNPHTVQYLMDGQGGTIGTIEQDSDLKNHVMIGGKDVMKIDVRGGRDLDFIGLTGGANSALAVEAGGHAGTIGLFTWASAGGLGNPLFSDANYDVSDAIQDERTGLIIGASYTDDLSQNRYFESGLQHVQSILEKAFPAQSVQIVSRDAAGSSYVVRTDGPRNPPVLSLYTSANHQVNIIQEAYPSLKSTDLGEVRPYPYTAKDGLDIHAYLTLPPGKEPRNLPTVIFPHGGPESRDSMNFNWWAQFMASRGYAVLQPNYRGSSGYGWNFVKAGDGEWTGKVQDDLDAGIQKLVSDGIADPKRICIVGGSWGGYLALVGATFTPDVYACAISYAGLSDLDHDLYTGTSFESESVSVWKRRLGADKDGSKLQAQSPANFADRVKIPILLIHSDKDTTVDIDQSEIEERALKRAGKDVEFVKLEGDDHYLEFADTRIKLLKEIERFLAAHIGDKARAEKQAN